MMNSNVNKNVSFTMTQGISLLSNPISICLPVGNGKEDYRVNTTIGRIVDSRPVYVPEGYEGVLRAVVENVLDLLDAVGAEQAVSITQYNSGKAVIEVEDIGAEGTCYGVARHVFVKPEESDPWIELVA